MTKRDRAKILRSVMTDSGRPSNSLAPDPKDKSADVVIICNHCQEAITFRAIGPNPRFDLSSFKGECYRCRQTFTSHDGNATIILGDVVDVLLASDDPIQKARDMIAALRHLEGVRDTKAAKRGGKLSKLKGWIPRSKKELTVYISLLVVLIELYKEKGPDRDAKKITTEQIVNVYNSSVVRQPNRATTKPKPTTQAHKAHKRPPAR